MMSYEKYNVESKTVGFEPQFGIRSQIGNRTRICTDTRGFFKKLKTLYCVLNENYTFGIGVRNYLRAVRKGLRTPNGHHKSVSLKRNAV